MSTLPGDDALRDAGLVRHDLDETVNRDEARNLVDETGRAPGLPDTTSAPEDYAPGAPRPDRAGGAEEADVLDQAWVVPAEPDEDTAQA